MGGGTRGQGRFACPALPFSGEPGESKAAAAASSDTRGRSCTRKGNNLGLFLCRKRTTLQGASCQDKIHISLARRSVHDFSKVSCGFFPLYHPPLSGTQPDANTCKEENELASLTLRLLMGGGCNSRTLVFH